MYSGSLLINRYGFERVSTETHGARYIYVGSANGDVTTFEFDGERERGGARLLVYRERDEQRRRFLQPVERIVERAVLPSHDHLTRVLWETDPEVIEFVERVGDFRMSIPDTDSVKNASFINGTRKLTAYERAWNRYEPKGSRERADDRAVMMIIKLASLWGAQPPPSGSDTK